ncbi:MAG TPA: tripartite tricarboxylate transporter substrate binding protein [Xanthobacteraceae bacterium]|nr:tripartite tricarboxylate transporter substrate binding protein [Xanthobacteraceae bacterium]
MSRWFRIILLPLAIACMLGADAARAQDYPTRPVFIVVGPGPDAMARLFGQKLTEAFGQQVLVDIQATAGGVVAARTVAKAAPDGHTMLLSTGVYSIMEVTRRDLPFSFLRDFEPVAEIGSLSFVLLASPSLGVSSLADLIALARKRPGEINCASSGVGTTAHLGCERLRQAANIDVVHVPYKGAPAALVDLLGGRVHVTFSVPTAAAHVKSGELRALAVTGSQRIAALPDVPTVAEAGLPDLEFGSWNGLHVPTGTPKPIIDKLNGAVAKARNLADVQTRMRDVGLEPEGGTPAEFGEFVRRDVERWGRIVKETGVKVE